MKPRKEPSNKKYVISCNACGYNKIIQGAEDITGLYEYKVPKIPGGVPTYDGVAKKIVTKKPHQRRKMFRCIQCGRGIVVRNFMTPESEMEKDIDEEKDINDGRETGASGSTIS